jgi:hypothetical protein
MRSSGGKEEEEELVRVKFNFPGLSADFVAELIASKKYCF